MTQTTTHTEHLHDDLDGGEFTRAKIIGDGIHSLAMEGLAVTPETKADAAEYIAGNITMDELGRRVRARYGITDGAA
jgi:hypothetical protein